MFDQTFVDGVGKTNKSWTVAASFGLEFLAVGVMILIPLIWTGVLPRASLVNMLTAPAPPPPPPAPRQPQPAQKIAKVVRRQIIGRTLEAPVTIPKQVAMLAGEPLAPPSTGVVGGGLDGGVSGGIQLSEPSIGPAPLPPPPPPVKERPKTQEGPYRRSSELQAARCVTCPKPVYPAFVRQARIQGAVVLSAVIAKDGTVRMLTVVSSANPLLTSAAMDAVKKWVYIPTILNQEPVEVVTEITVNFTLQ